MDEEHLLSEQQLEEQRENNLPVGVWLLILLCAVVVVAAFAGGAAYTGVSQARHVAAKASLGQIESTFLMADRAAADEGLKPPGDGAESLIRSYDTTGGGTAYEQYVQSAMLDAFGAARDFDFAVSRFEDAAGQHTRILYFPVAGRTDTGRDPYYLMLDGAILDSR